MYMCRFSGVKSSSKGNIIMYFTHLTLLVDTICITKVAIKNFLGHNHNVAETFFMDAFTFIIYPLAPRSVFIDECPHSSLSCHMQDS